MSIKVSSEEERGKIDQYYLLLYCHQYALIWTVATSIIDLAQTNPQNYSYEVSYINFLSKSNQELIVAALKISGYFN